MAIKISDEGISILNSFWIIFLNRIANSELPPIKNRLSFFLMESTFNKFWQISINLFSYSVNVSTSVESNLSISVLGSGRAFRSTFFKTRSKN